MSKKKVLTIIISAALLIAVCISIGISGVLSPYERQLVAAYKLLNEGKYEEAILAFDKAIDIDVKRDKAYIGKADVYVARCDENTLEDIKAVLKTAYNQHYNDKNIVNGMIRISDKLINMGKPEWAMELLKFSYNMTQNYKIKEKIESIEKEHLNPVLKKLYSFFENNNKEAIEKYIHTKEFADAVVYAPYNKSSLEAYTWFPQKDVNSPGITVWASIEANGEREDVNISTVLMYYGNYLNGMRDGNGTWLHGTEWNTTYNCNAKKTSGFTFRWYEGGWKNDEPNGFGIQTMNGCSEALTEEWRGNFVDGMFDGDFTYKVKYYDGTEGYFEKVMFDNGTIIKHNDNFSDNYGLKGQVKDMWAASIFRGENGTQHKYGIFPFGGGYK